MEAALARDEQRLSNRRAAIDAVRRFEALLTGGERRAAVAAAGMLAAAGVQEAATANARATRIATGLIAGRGINVRGPGGPWWRVALLPACLGRDRGVEVPLRDPSVSRRHALLRAGDDGITIEDAGSRGGIQIGGARVDSPLPLRGSGEIGLGGATALRFTAGDRTVMLEGNGGLDRSLRALIGADSVALAPLFPGRGGAGAHVRGRRAPGAPPRGQGPRRRPVHRSGLRSGARRRHRDLRKVGRCGRCAPPAGGRVTGPRPLRPDRLLEEAERAQRAGDFAAAAVALRSHLDTHPDDVRSRLRFATVLIALGEGGRARGLLAPLEAGDDDDVRRESVRRLAELDEAEGAVLAATERWEKILADDIDDPQARTQLALLRPTRSDADIDASQTLVSPAGVETLRFRLLREIGRGATATVYLARDEALTLDVALKVLHPQFSGQGPFGVAAPVLRRRPDRGRRSVTPASSPSTTWTRRRALSRWSGSRAARCASACASTRRACRRRRCRRRPGACWAR